MCPPAGLRAASVSEVNFSESAGGSGQRPPSHWPHLGRPNHTTQAARALHATWMALHASWAGGIQPDSNHDEQPGPAGALPLPASTCHVWPPGLVFSSWCRARATGGCGASLRLSPSRRDLGCQPRARPPGGPARLGQLVLVAELARYGRCVMFQIDPKGSRAIAAIRMPVLRSRQQ